MPKRTLMPRLQRSATHALAPVQREFDRLFDELGQGWQALTDIDPMPRMNLSQTKDMVELTVELPGLSRDDVDLTIDDDILTVSGEKRHDEDAEGRRYRMLERAFGTFSRSVSLPRGVDTSKVEATMADGVLKVVLPKRAAAEPTAIPIRSKE